MGSILTNRGASLKNALHFIGIAGIGWLVDNLVFFLMVAVLHGSAFFANFAGGLCGATITFIGARERLFGTRRGRTWVRLSAYLAYTLLLLVVASAGVQWLTLVLQALSSAFSADWIAMPGAAMLAKLAVTPFTLMLNYLMARFLSTR